MVGGWGEGEEGSVGGGEQPLQLTSGWRCRIPLGVDWFFLLGQDQVLDEEPEFSEYPLSPPPFCLGPSGDTFFSLFVFSFFVLVAFCCCFVLLLGWR